MTPIVLASSSPRRRELLRRGGVRITVVEPPPDVTPPPGMSADLAAQLVARQKAMAVVKLVPEGTFVIAADTVVVGPHGTLGKPGTPARARAYLDQLCGIRHSVLTGICVVAVTDSDEDSDEQLALSRSVVKMRAFSDADRDEYIASGEPLDKAGAYAIQGGGSAFVEGVQGRVDTVIGLDVALTFRLLAAAGYPDPLPEVVDATLVQRSARRSLAPMRAGAR